MSFLDTGSDTHSTIAPDADWWRGAVIYQIYPRSYQDSNGDGIGDLAGIIHRLDHVASLGVDAIWLSPFFTSPMQDFGYDVSDYRDVDPMFGSLADFDALVARAHQLGLRVMIDLVLSHTSDQHPWFRESRVSRDNAKSDWYVWADAKPDGTAPNNWLSIFGGPAWEWDSQRMQYYLHNFLASQPDLNFHCPEVQDELLSVARFWLERGVDGFRLDTVNFYVHDKELRDNPALPEDEKDSTIAPSVNPYTFQEHLYDKSRPENLGFLERLRSVMDDFADITSVGEVGDDQRGLQIQSEYTSGNERLHMCYGFDFLSAPFPTGERIASVLAAFGEVAPDGWACWAFSNHDVERHVSRWQLKLDSRKLYAALLMSLRGSVCLYQGEELGLPEGYVAFEDLQDPYGKRFWPKYKGRDGCRTPMPWSHEQPNAGFSDAKPWLPVAVEHVQMAVDRQEDDPESSLNFYRDFIAFRANHKALSKGEFEPISTEEALITFIRSQGDEKMFCAFNLSDQPRTVDLPNGDWTFEEVPHFRTKHDGSSVTLPPWQAAFAPAR